MSFKKMKTHSRIYFITNITGFQKLNNVETKKIKWRQNKRMPHRDLLYHFYKPRVILGKIYFILYVIYMINNIYTLTFFYVSMESYMHIFSLKINNLVVLLYHYISYYILVL